MFYIEMFNKSNNQYNGLNKIINSKLFTYRKLYDQNEVYNILLILRNLDILLKSTNIDDEILFTPIIYKICKNYYV